MRDQYIRENYDCNKFYQKKSVCSFQIKGVTFILRKKAEKLSRQAKKNPNELRTILSLHSDTVEIPMALNLISSVVVT